MDTSPQRKLLSWTEIRTYSDYVRQEGIKQFINLYRKVKDRKAEPFVWGDEIEYILIKSDDVKKTARVLPKNTLLLPQLNEISTKETRDNHGSIWMTEYGSNQLESTPARPFGCTFSAFSTVEANMRLRRQQVKEVLDGENGEVCLTITQLPRWRAFSESLDGRSKEERGLKPLKQSQFVIPKSRFDTVSFYLSSENAFLNDVTAPYDEVMLQQLLNGGVDVDLARNIAYIFIREPLTLYEETIHQNEEDTGHFYNIFSTNWQSLRLKPPPLEGDIGWRVEFRPLEVQLTDFENAAYVTFVMLLVRAIDKFKLDLTVPISKVDSNMKEAQARDAVERKTFFFKETLESRSGEKDTYTQMSIDVIMNGGVTPSGAEFPGLIPIIKRYITTEEHADDTTSATISRYLQLISDRAAGRVNTIAKWIRNLVAEHPDYKHDSVISERINYDLVKYFSDISNGIVGPQHLNNTLSRDYQAGVESTEC
ncbi:Glutamate--cysteine ligase catalytic subunit [Holothuria leucospilota]|uniref:Glutamate--cysteine ligase n=1 Tax=Holothuria leucospilota TaxID=206669 RepID=A0A9Q1BYA3_HOLLE|nr:Glutamate--cysteine ligase catalytic subunit [Holothuria leucospilota]